MCSIVEPDITEKIYSILTNRRFRAGARPSDKTKSLIIKKIKLKIQKNESIEILQFWGGCKNQNLSVNSADLCEEATLDNLYKLNSKIREIYPPGLKIWICPGDIRVEKANLIPREETQKYVETLKEIAQKEKYCKLFTIIPLSNLYKKYAHDMIEQISIARAKFSDKISLQDGFYKLVANAKKNIFNKDLANERDIEASSIRAAKDYVIYRIAEEESQIFREFDDCIRSFFIKYTSFYKQYLSDINKTMPHLDCFLTLFTGKKGNITQPWQAIGKKTEKDVVFLSQERLKNQEQSIINI